MIVFYRPEEVLNSFDSLNLLKSQVSYFLTRIEYHCSWSKLASFIGEAAELLQHENVPDNQIAPELRTPYLILSESIANGNYGLLLSGPTRGSQEMTIDYYCL